MKKTIINTGGALAIATVAAGLSVSSNDVQAADCAGANLINVLTGIPVDLTAAATLVTGATYVLATPTGCAVKVAVTVPDSATVTIVDSTGFDFTAGSFVLGKGATANYFCGAGATCKVGVTGPSTSATLNVAGPAFTLLTEGAEASKVTINAKSNMDLTGPTTVTSTLSVPAGVTVTTKVITAIPAKVTATGAIKAAVANTVITGK